MKADRDIEKTYPLGEFVEKLRRLANALENGKRFEIEIAGERISVPVRATYNIEHEEEQARKRSSSRSSGRPKSPQSRSGRASATHRRA